MRWNDGRHLVDFWVRLVKADLESSGVVILVEPQDRGSYEDPLELDVLVISLR